MIHFLKNFAVLLICSVAVFINWWFLAWLSDFSIVLGWVVGSAFLFIVPAVVFLVVLGFQTEHNDAPPMIFVTPMLTVLLMIGSILIVPLFMQHDTCQSTFESAFDDAKNCDYLCFEELTPVTESPVSFRYSYVRFGEPHYATSHYIPIQTPADVFIWVRGKADEQLSGKCIRQGAVDQDYQHLNQYAQNRAVLGRVTPDPTADLDDLRKNIIPTLIAISLIFALGVSMYSRRRKETAATQAPKKQ